MDQVAVGMLKSRVLQLERHLMKWRDDYAHTNGCVSVPVHQIEALVGVKSVERQWAPKIPGCIFCDGGHPGEFYEGRRIHDGGRGEHPCPSYEK